MGWPMILPYRQRRLVSIWDVVKGTRDIFVKVRKSGKTKKKQFHWVRMELEVLL